MSFMTEDCVCAASVGPSQAAPTAAAPRSGRLHQHARARHRRTICDGRSQLRTFGCAEWPYLLTSPAAIERQGGSLEVVNAARRPETAQMKSFMGAAVAALSCCTLVDGCQP
jgi:hypothetical protein